MSNLRDLFGQEPIVGKPKDTTLPKDYFPPLTNVDRMETRSRLAHEYKKHPRTSGYWFSFGFLVFIFVAIALTMSGDSGSYIKMICINPAVGFLVSLPFFAASMVRGEGGR